MAGYKYGDYLKQYTDSAYDVIYEPGAMAPNPGIYRCIGCGMEIGVAGGHILPTQNDHQHLQLQGRIGWQLLVYAQGRS